MRVLAITLAALGVFSMSAGAARAGCARPDPQALNGGPDLGFYRVQTTPLGVQGKRLRWATLSLTSQLMGSASVINCRGAVRASIALGAVELQKPGPVVAGLPTLIVIYHPASGTNINIQNVALLQYRKGAIDKLWDHLRFQGEYPPKHLGHQHETTYQWKFTSDARRIEVAGRDLIFRDQAVLGPLHKSDIRRIDRLRPERFCLNRQSTKYLLCR